MKSYKLKLITTSIFIGIAFNINTFKSYLNSIINNESPQLIFVLGGDTERENVGASLAKVLKLPLIISGGSNPEYANWNLEKRGLKDNQFSLDYRAKDTLTNFTSLIDEFNKRGITHAFLITSEDHLPRASNVGKIIAGSRGIKLTNISVPCKPYCKNEPLEKQLGDPIRALVWVLTGKDLKNIK